MPRFLAPALLLLCFPLVLEAAAPAPLPTAGADKPVAEAPSAADKDEPYTVSGIKVDVAAENSMKARDKAFTEGQRAAFEELVRRMVTDGHFKPESVTDAELGKLVQSFEIESERASGTRYVATMTFHFRPQEAASLFEKRNVAFTEDPYAKTKPAPGMPGEAAAPAGPRMLILPLLRAGDKNILWEEKTLWAKAWENLLSDYPAPDFIVSEGTPEDAASISGNDALAGKPDALLHAMGLHQAQGAVVAALMSPSASPASYQNLTIQLTRFDASGRMIGSTFVPLHAEPDRSSIVWLQTGAGASLIQLRNIARAGQPGGQPGATAAQAAAPAKPGDIYAPTAATRLTAVVPFNNMSEWSAMREAMQQIPGLVQMETLRMNRNRAVVLLGFTGARDQLAAALAAKNLRLDSATQPDGTVMLQAATQPSVIPLTGAAPPTQFQTVYPSAPGPAAAPQQAGAPQPPPETPPASEDESEQ